MRVAFPQAAPELLGRHVVALARELLEPLQPARGRADAAPLEQRREILLACRHAGILAHDDNENRYRSRSDHAGSFRLRRLADDQGQARRRRRRERVREHRPADRRLPPPRHLPPPPPPRPPPPPPTPPLQPGPRTHSPTRAAG